MNPTFRSGAIALSALLLLSACKDQQPAGQPASTPDEQAPIATAPAQPRLGVEGDPATMADPAGMRMPEPPARDATPVDARIEGVTLSNQGDTETNIIGPPTSLFDPHDTVYAEVHTEGTAQEYTVYARWVSADGTELSDYGIKVGQLGSSRTVISLSKPDGLESGENRIEVAINGQPARIVTFRVR